MKFPQRIPGQAPEPAQNKIAVSTDFSVDVVPEGELVGFEFLSIKAMAPVIMVHGWHSGPWWWGPSPSRGVSSVYPDGCGFDADYPGVDYIDGSFNFIQPFINSKIPFNCSVDIFNEDPVKIGGAALEQSILAANGVAVDCRGLR